MSNDSEILIKGSESFNATRERIRDYYIEGLSRFSNYDGAERSNRKIHTRISSFLEDCIINSDKKTYISLDTRKCEENPFFRLWQIKKSSDEDMTLLFIILDILSDGKEKTLTEISDLVDEYIEKVYDKDFLIHKDTIRNRLKEYTELGIIDCKESKNKLWYCLHYDRDIIELLFDSFGEEALHFTSETMPCGIIGFLILENLSLYRSTDIHFKHHYLSNALDSEIMLKLLAAIYRKKSVILTVKSQNVEIVPIKILYKIQKGEICIAGVNIKSQRSQIWKLSNIDIVEECNEEPFFQKYQEQISNALKYSWGGNLSDNLANLDYVEFDIVYSEKLLHVYKRLQKEKKHGKIERINEYRVHFSIDVSDANEMVPWIRSFFAYIENLYISNNTVMNQFINDYYEIKKLYGIED